MDPSLFIDYNRDEYISMVIYIDDSLIFGPSPELEKKFTDSMIKRFKLELKYGVIGLWELYSVEGKMVAIYWIKKINFLECFG